MAHSLSAKKRIRQNVKRNALNRWRKDRVKDAVKAFDAAVEAGNVDEAQKLLNQAASVIDKVASTPALHKNTAARRRSRLARKLNAAKAAKPGA
jgi:small subunit ribosomal protein S20